MNLILSRDIPAGNKLRLAILYALRYQKLPGNAIAGVVDALIANGVSADRARVSTYLFPLNRPQRPSMRVY